MEATEKTKTNGQAEILQPQMNKIEAVETKQATEEHKKSNQTQQRTISPEQLQLLVMQSLNNVNAKKDELTIAIKQLGDLATQLSKICAQQNNMLKDLKSEG